MMLRNCIRVFLVACSLYFARFSSYFGHFDQLFFWAESLRSYRARIWLKMASTKSHCLFPTRLTLCDYDFCARNCNFGKQGTWVEFCFQDSFSQFSGADSGQLGDPLCESGKPRRRKAHHLLKSPFFLETHGADWKDSVREGGTPNRRRWRTSSILACFRHFSRFQLTQLLMSDSGSFGISGKLTTPTFQWHKSRNVLISGHETAVFEIRATGLISLVMVRFPVKIPSNSVMLLTNRDNQLLSDLVILEKLPAFWKLMVWIRKILREKAASKWVFFCLKYLVKFY